MNNNFEQSDDFNDDRYSSIVVNIKILKKLTGIVACVYKITGGQTVFNHKMFNRAIMIQTGAMTDKTVRRYKEVLEDFDFIICSPEKIVFTERTLKKFGIKRQKQEIKKNVKTSSENEIEKPKSPFEIEADRYTEMIKQSRPENPEGEEPLGWRCVECKNVMPFIQGEMPKKCKKCNFPGIQLIFKP